MRVIENKFPKEIWNYAIEPCGAAWAVNRYGAAPDFIREQVDVFENLADAKKCLRRWKGVKRRR